MVFLLALYIAMHESIHMAIDTNYGCKSTFGISWLGVYTYTDVATCDSTDGLRAVQSVNEIVGYTGLFFMSLWLGIKIKEE